MIGEVIEEIIKSSFQFFFEEVILRIYNLVVNILEFIKFKKTLLAFIVFLDTVLFMYILPHLEVSDILSFFLLAATIALIVGLLISIVSKKLTWLKSIINTLLVLFFSLCLISLTGLILKILGHWPY